MRHFLSMLYKENVGESVFTYLCVLTSLVKLSFATTCPHTIIIGGLLGVDCSFETGHAKIEWYLFSAGRGISILVD